MQKIINNLNAFNACLINRSLGLRLTYLTGQGFYVLRDSNRKVIATARLFSTIEEKAETLADRPIRIAA